MKRILALAAFISLNTATAFSQQVNILIDPGHGGRDPGHLPSNANGLQEKVLALEIALKVGHYLTNNLTNVNVDFTRTDDSYPTLDERVEMANSGAYDYMLSVHINGSPKPQVYGTETHIHDFQSKHALKWAKLVEDQFKKRAGRRSRGVKTQDDLGHSLQILKFTKIPTILVECGFITNGSESYYLSTVYGQEIIASAIFRATREFFQIKHPEINFIPTPAEEILEVEELDTISNEKAYYRVQIMSSIEPVDTHIPAFEKLEYPVERIQVETNSLFKYKYCVGMFETKKEAKPIQKEVQEKGFKDAFITLLK